jgi:hypothetical protein
MDADPDAVPDISGAVQGLTNWWNAPSILEKLSSADPNTYRQGAVELALALGGGTGAARGMSRFRPGPIPTMRWGIVDPATGAVRYVPFDPAMGQYFRNRVQAGTVPWLPPIYGPGGGGM